VVRSDSGARSSRDLDPGPRWLCGGDRQPGRGSALAGHCDAWRQEGLDFRLPARGAGASLSKWIAPSFSAVARSRYGTDPRGCSIRSTGR
jgi:hypothetical protein